jgi:hypothetical protein
VLRLPGDGPRLIAKKCYVTKDKEKFLYVFDYQTSHNGDGKISLPGKKGTEFVPFQDYVQLAGNTDSGNEEL